MAKTVVLCAANEVVEGEIKQAPLPDGSNVALYRVDGAIYATADMCTHGEASLAAEGIITGNSWSVTIMVRDIVVRTVALVKLSDICTSSMVKPLICTLPVLK